MIPIEGDPGPAVDAVAELADTIAAYGGRSASGARCHVDQDGALSIRAPAAVSANARLLEVPEAVLPRVSAFDLRIRADRFVIDGVASDVAAGEHAAMAGLLAAYNACEKPRTWRRDSPWFALASDRAVLDQLVAGRSAAKKITGYREQLENGETEALLRDSFLGARIFNLKPDEDESVQGGPILMPFIDFLNHHPRSRAYQLTRDQPEHPRTLWTYADRPVPETEECFVHYNFMDRLDTYLLYGFVDAYAPRVMSLPLELTLLDGVTIDVRGEGGPPFKGKLPQKAQDLRGFFPQIRQREGKRLVVQRLIVPDANAPYALRRVLRWLVSAVAPRASADWLQACAEEGEVQLVQSNVDYYAELRRRVEAARDREPLAADPEGREQALTAVEQLARAQEDYLRAYAERMGVLV